MYLQTLLVLQSKHIANKYDLPLIKLQVRQIKCFLNHELCLSIFLFRSFLPNGSRTIIKVSVSCWLMAQSFTILNLHHLIENCSPTSSTAMLFDMRLLSQSKGATCFGSMDPFLQESSAKSASFTTVLSIYLFLRKGRS